MVRLADCGYLLRCRLLSRDGGEAGAAWRLRLLPCQTQLAGCELGHFRHCADCALVGRIRGLWRSLCTDPSGEAGTFEPDHTCVANELLSGPGANDKRHLRLRANAALVCGPGSAQRLRGGVSFSGNCWPKYHGVRDHWILLQLRATSDPDALPLRLRGLLHKRRLANLRARHRVPRRMVRRRIRYFPLFCGHRPLQRDQCHLCGEYDDGCHRRREGREGPAFGR
mmetsp:Transcript_60735/g.142072  ORF Transcript_60735/g.142072 Transcript_60735/m.142072 type:complete len:225 (+) Transcript_60735:660-1334(+)